ncbi:hypothetical protein [Hydrogenophaga sp.]|uniref:hypothetical protein n=1 Tax=Hydrogenophaga sp. TaxID=1904254 RepID=UPI00356350C7
MSIASGCGSASTARVMRFVDEFSTHAAAADYALAQGIDWVRGATGATAPQAARSICPNTNLIETRN